MGKSSLFLATLYFVVLVSFVLPGCKTEAAGSDDYAAQCIIIQSCSDDWNISMYGGYSSIGECVEHLKHWGSGWSYDWWHGNFDPVLALCLKDAKGDCVKAFACINAGHQTEICDYSTFVPFCDGNLAVNCFSGSPDDYLEYTDCSQVSQVADEPWAITCQIEPSGGNDARCLPPVCEEGSERCENNAFLDCYGGYQDFLDCGDPQISVCQTEEMMGYITGGCQGTGASCSEDGPYRCEGDVLVDCSMGKDLREDCAALGNYTCEELEDGGAECTGKGTECDMADGDACDGSVLRYCEGGLYKSVDCKSLGFTVCGLDPDYGTAWCE